MALPLSNAEDEDELVHGLDTTGYAQIPADHLSDSSESSFGTSCATSLQMENLAAFHNVDSVHNSTPLQNGAYLAHSNDMRIQAATHNEDAVAPYENGRHVTHIAGMQNQAVVHGTLFQNGNHATHTDGMENQGAGSSSDTSCGNVVWIDGMEIHVYGELSSRMLGNLGNHDDREDIDDEDDVDERERQHAEDAAFQRAKEADDARRLAPLSPEQCQAIKNAMQSISLGGFRPEWANRVPEEQWVNRLRRKSLSKSTEG